jgi:hypothetical protein
MPESVVVRERRSATGSHELVVSGRGRGETTR